MFVRPDNIIHLCSKGNLKQAFTTNLSLIWSQPRLISHLLKLCVQRRFLFQAQQLHSISLVSGSSTITFVSNHILNAYLKLGQIGSARKLFDEMSHRNVMSYNILIGGFIQNGELGAALELFNEMGERNSASWNAVITGLITVEANEEGLRLFGRMRESGCLPDVFTLGSVLRGCAGLQGLSMGEQVHGYAVRSGLECDSVIGRALAHMYMRCGRLSEGERVIRLVPVQNVVAFNTLIAGRVQNGQAAGAVCMYRMMRRGGFRPDKITFVSVISSCADLATLGQGRQIHAEVVKSGAAAADVRSTLIGMYSRCGSLDDAVKVFGERDRTDKDDVLWSSVIAAYGVYGRGHEAIEVFKQMEYAGIKADDVTFLNLLYSCSHSGLVDEGLELFNMMVNYGLEPQIKHYTCVVDLLGRAGRLEEAEHVIRSMPVQPDAIIWKTLLSACKTHKNVDAAARIAKEILKLDPLDSASYVLLSNTHATDNRWKEASEVRSAMKEKMVKKMPGLSWFEFKHQVHFFIMGERSHPQSDEINLYLKELMDELRTHGYVPDIGAVMHDMDEEEKEYNVAHHTEKLAVAFALMRTPQGVPIRIMKNLRVCDDCHVVMKHISVVKNREIILRDTSRFHHFKNGHCSCQDYW